MKNKMQ